MPRGLWFPRTLAPKATLIMVLGTRVSESFDKPSGMGNQHWLLSVQDLSRGPKTFAKRHACAEESPGDRNTGLQFRNVI